MKLDSNSLTFENDGVMVRLTPQLFLILKKLASPPGRYISRERVLAELGRGTKDGAERTVSSVNVQICNLRRRIEPTGAIIHTIHGHGWALIIDNQPQPERPTQ